VVGVVAGMAPGRDVRSARPVDLLQPWILRQSVGAGPEADRGAGRADVDVATENGPLERRRDVQGTLELGELWVVAAASNGLV